MRKLTKTILVSSLALVALMILFTDYLNIPTQFNNSSSEVNPVRVQSFQLDSEEISKGKVSYTSPRYEKPVVFSLKEMRHWDSRYKRMVEDWFKHIHERLCEGLPEDCSNPDTMSYAVIINLKQLKVYLSAGVAVIEDRRGEKGLRQYHRSNLIDLDSDVYVGLMFEEVEKSFEPQER